MATSELNNLMEQALKDRSFDFYETGYCPAGIRIFMPKSRGFLRESFSIVKVFSELYVRMIFCYCKNGG